MKKLDKKSTIIISVAASLTIFMAAMGATLAIMTQSTESRSNNFTFGKVDIELEEPGWEENDHILYPGRTVPKDPIVTNTGINDLYVFLEVRIPKADVLIVDEIDKGKIISAPSMQLVKTVYQDSEGNTIDDHNPDWIQIDEYDIGNDYHCIIYGYKERLAGYKDEQTPGETTTQLFDKVTFVNAVEGEPEKMSFDMPIKAYAIQADYLDGVEDNDITEKLKKAYDLYVKSVNS